VSRILVALGGNAIQRAHDAGTWSEAVRQMRRTAPALAGIAARGHELVVTHGNGPQVGDLLREAELGAREVPPPPLHVLDAESEGQIGYLIAQELGAALTRAGVARTVVSLVCRTEVSRSDPEFRHPSKPVGRFYRREEAARLRRRSGWTLRADARRGGWRRVVPSPRPLRWLEGDVIRGALDGGLGDRCVFVVTGGGGVPVVRRGRGAWEGVEAVIDKDRTAAVVARQLHCSSLAIVTDVPGAAVGFGTPDSRWLGRVSAKELRAHLAAGEFAEGSMRPKVTAGLEFLRAGGSFFAISDIRSLRAALEGRAGTRVGRPPA
jgi:carbamate kinase